MIRRLVSLILMFLLLASCEKKPKGDIVPIDKHPSIEPDYSEVTLPPNISPINFMINEKGSAFYVKFISGGENDFDICSKNNKIIIPGGKWRSFLSGLRGKEFNIEINLSDENGKWMKFKSITNYVAAEPIDPYLYYRLLYPGYESWSELSINFRNTESFDEKSFVENSIAEDNCINCHSFNNGKTDDFMFHMRGSLGGTYFYNSGSFRKINLKTKEMKNGAVYPRWHPSGKFVAFSSNKIIQRFHSADNKKVEVSDLESSLVLYDVSKNEMMDIELTDKQKFMDTFPEWSPDGKYLYFCRADSIGEQYDFKQIKYDIYRVQFNNVARTFGEAELILDAKSINKSASFPRISPDGKILIITIADYGTFPIWHKEADLYSIDTETRKFTKLNINSDFTDSYHSWSSNGRWLVFSSKRDDGITARPYFAYFDKDGNPKKPFILPQKDPEFYARFLKSFNIPEFSVNKIEMTPGKLRNLVKSDAKQAGWSDGN